MERSDILWLAAFALGFAFTFMVGGIPIGLGLFLFMNALVGALVYFGNKNKTAKELTSTKASTILLWIFTFFYVVLSIPFLYRLDTSITVSSILVQIGLLLFGALYFALPSALHIIDIFSLILSPITLAITWMIESIKSVVELFRGNVNVVRFIIKIILYTALSLFVFIMFARLLAQVDAEFKTRIEYLLDSLRLAEIMTRIVFGVVVSFIAAGLLTIVGTMNALPFFGTSHEKATELWKKAFSVVYSKRSDALLPIVVTVPVLLLFGLYVWVQFTFIFGQDLSVILAKYSFAEYAQRGFAELLIVAILTYPILAWSMNQAKSTWIVPRATTFAINTGIVGLLIVMLQSLFIRMNVYMDAYGPSLLRTYVLVGAVFVGIVLLAYEILAVLKLRKPGFAIFNGRFFGDFLIVGIVAALALLSTLSLVPWSKVVTSQIIARYNDTGKIDVFQLTQLPSEVQGEVYKFADTLSQDGAEEGALFLKAHAVTARQTYTKSRNVSLFTNVFGFNFAGYILQRNVPDIAVVSISENFTSIVNNKIKSTNELYASALSTNNFTLARSLFDPEMKANDISGFSDVIQLIPTNTTTVGIDFSQKQPYMDVSAEQLLQQNGQKSAYSSVYFIVNRFSGTHRGTEKDVPVNLTYSFRDGKLVLTSSSIVMSYLPDAIAQDGNTSFGEYGYETYCAVPTLEVLFSAYRGCSEDRFSTENVYTDVLGRSMISFYKEDFRTK